MLNPAAAPVPLDHRRPRGLAPWPGLPTSPSGKAVPQTVAWDASDAHGARLGGWRPESLRTTPRRPGRDPALHPDLRRGRRERGQSRADGHRRTGADHIDLNFGCPCPVLPSAAAARLARGKHGPVPAIVSTAVREAGTFP
ncbi:hypothetical protein QJS66_07045 [Kocuria rhizophila]|nr:hypothetical protein QJS66_07045 [Kocuria rhizophila]